MKDTAMTTEDAIQRGAELAQRIEADMAELKGLIDDHDTDGLLSGYRRTLKAQRILFRAWHKSVTDAIRGAMPTVNFGGGGK